MVGICQCSVHAKLQARAGLHFVSELSRGDAGDIFHTRTLGGDSTTKAVVSYPGIARLAWQCFRCKLTTPIAGKPRACTDLPITDLQT